jgi:hypothetical protein
MIDTLVVLALAVTQAMWSTAPLPKELCSYLAKSAPARKAMPSAKPTPEQQNSRSHIYHWPGESDDQGDIITVYHDGRPLDILFPDGLGHPDVCHIVERGPLVPL